jgi:hypothetical protein
LPEECNSGSIVPAARSARVIVRTTHGRTAAAARTARRRFVASFSETPTVLSRPMVRRLLLLHAVIATALVGAFAASPAWARSVGLDVWNASELEREKRAAVERRSELEAADAEICRRIGAKEEVAEGLITGSISLAEATDRFLALNRPYPEYVNMIRETFPGSTDEEKTARNVIAYCLLRANSPAEQEQLAQRFEAQFRAMFEGRTAAN